jgi:hypothetical protein
MGNLHVKRAVRFCPDWLARKPHGSLQLLNVYFLLLSESWIPCDVLFAEASLPVSIVMVVW